jgi:hypothetical protein
VLVASLSENVKVSDTVSAQVTPLQVILSETLRLEDEVLQASGAKVTVSDAVVTALTLSDAVVTTIIVGDVLLVVAP